MRSEMQQTIEKSRSTWSIQDFSTTGVRDVGEFIKTHSGTWEAPIFLCQETGRVFETKPSKGKRSEMRVGESESIVVVTKGGNASGAKGWRISMTGKRKR